MNPKQAAFVREYLVDCNGTQAAIRAGYSPRTANEQAARLLADISIRAAVEAGQKAKVAETGVTKARVVAMALEGTQMAKEMQSASAFLRGVELLAKLHGHIVERRDTRVIKSIEDLTEDELAALEAQAQAADAKAVKH